MRCAGTTVTLPRLGTIRTHESTRKLARRLKAGTARILSATVSRTAQRWFVSFAASGAERLTACGGIIRPGTAGHVPLKQEPGTARAGKTGTVAGQPAAAELEFAH
jgi:putative transposase